MGKQIPEVDEYISKAAEFARPMLEKIRKAFHDADPGITESIKWGAPHFDKDGIVGSMAAFKAHLGIHFWNGGQMKDPEGLLTPVGEGKMASIRVDRGGKLPAHAVLVRYVRDAVGLVGAKPKSAKPASGKAKAMEMPADFAAALKRNAKARAVFEAFSQSKKNEYIEWIAGAKQEATRQRRLETSLEWLEEGKSKNWKYEKC